MMDQRAFMRGFFDEMEKQAVLPALAAAVPWLIRAAPAALRMAKAVAPVAKRVATKVPNLMKGMGGKMNVLSDTANIIKARAQQQGQPAQGTPDGGSIVTP